MQQGFLEPRKVILTIKQYVFHTQKLKLKKVLEALELHNMGYWLSTATNHPPIHPSCLSDVADGDWCCSTREVAGAIEDLRIVLPIADIHIGLVTWGVIWQVTFGNFLSFLFEIFFWCEHGRSHGYGQQGKSWEYWTTLGVIS